MRFFSVLFVSSVWSIQSSVAEVVTWSNVEPRLNVTGDIMDAHDGSYHQWDGPGTPFFYYAMGYGNCVQDTDLCNGECGYGYSWIGVWKSDNLTSGSWTLIQDARDDTWPKGDEVGAYFRVHATYNKNTSKYVLWVNVNGAPQCPTESLTEPCYFVGTSSTPEGPFTFTGASGARFSGPGDFDLFVDDDDTGYLIYTSTLEGHRMSVEKLTDDYLLSVYSPTPTGTAAVTSDKLSQQLLEFKTGSSGDDDAAATDDSSGYFGNEFVEAPSLFKRNGVYYSLFGECCCFCGGGSGIGVYTSTQSPLGPWTYHENIGCTGGEPPSGCGCGMHGIDTCPDLYDTAITQAQQNFVLKITSKDGSDDQFIWSGDRWQSAEDGIKSHDFQYWFPLNFTLMDGEIALPQPIHWIDSFDIEL